MSLENKRTTYKDLVDNLKEMDNLNNSITTARLLLGRDLRKIDIESDDVVSLIINTIKISFMVSDILALGRKHIFWPLYQSFALRMESEFRVFQ
jgi:hypothetical protein